MKRTKTKPRDTHHRLPHPISPYGISKSEIQGVTTPLRLSVLSDLYALVSHIPCEQYYVARTQPRQYKFIFFFKDFRKQFTIIPTLETLTSMYREVLNGDN